jgi:hypothetical protein
MAVWLQSALATKKKRPGSLPAFRIVDVKREAYFTSARLGGGVAGHDLISVS